MGFAITSTKRYQRLVGWLMCKALARDAGRRRAGQRGTAALEFALVMPTVIILMVGIGTFGLAYYAEQVLVDMAGEVARACALKHLGSSTANVESCVQSMGAAFASSDVHHDVCLGSPVSFIPRIIDPGGGATDARLTGTRYPSHIYALEVTASCRWTYAPGYSGMLGGGSIGVLQGAATMPFILETSPI